MLNLSMVVEHSARLDPEREAVVSGATRLTYRELNAMASQVANVLRALGIAPGESVALSCPNIAWFPIAYYGILKTGAVVVPLNTLLKEREIAYHLRDCDARAYLCFEGTADLPMAAYGHAAFLAASECRHFVPIMAKSDAPSCIAGAATLGELMREQPAHAESTLRNSDDTAVMLYTSGTTGQPKGAELTHSNMLTNAQFARELLPSRDGVPARTIGVLPLFHSFGQTVVMNGQMLAGNTIVLLPRFEPAATLELMLRERVNNFAGVPTMYWSLLTYVQQHPGLDVSALATQLHSCGSGGAPIPVEILHAFDRTFGVEILEGYGLSETSPVATFNQRGRPRKPGSIGTPVFGCEIRIVDGADVEVPVGEAGELVVRGCNVMKGYYNRPDATAEAMRGGWFHTGDVARADADGFLYICDRIKDVILRGGMNVYPREVEEVLITHPDISLVAVIGVPHEELGEEVKAFVQRMPGSTLDASELIAWAREQMAAFKYPREVTFVESFPMTSTGKILKRELRTTPAG